MDNLPPLEEVLLVHHVLTEELAKRGDAEP